MELSERYMQKFEDEGFASVYEWQDPAGTVYETATQVGKKSLFVTDGSATLDINGETKELTAGQRLNIPNGVTYSAVIGPSGWIVIVGEG